MTDNRDSPAVEVLGLSKVYHRLVAVDTISFTTYRGEAFGFLGPNGAGKSTVVKMLTGLVRPTSGTIRVLGKPVNNMEMRRRVGYLPELPTFHRWLRAKEFLDFHGQLYGLRGPLLVKRAKEVLEMVGLEGREQQPLGTFSKGMLQRIGLAQALLNRPELLILDELVSGLDPVGVRDMRELLRQLKAEGISIFLNSHQLADVEALCDRVAIINKGHILKVGRPATLFDEPAEIELRVSEVCETLLRRLGSVALAVRQVENDPQRLVLEVEQKDQAAEAAEIVHACGIRLYALTPRSHSLEQLFFHAIDSANNDTDKDQQKTTPHTLPDNH